MFFWGHSVVLTVNSHVPSTHQLFGDNLLRDKLHPSETVVVIVILFIDNDLVGILLDYDALTHVVGGRVVLQLDAGKHCVPVLNVTRSIIIINTQIIIYLYSPHLAE